MTIGRILTGLLAATILLLGLWIAIYISNPVGMWIYLLITLLCTAFITEVVKSINGQRFFWEFLSPPDKLITFVDFVLVFIFGLFPLEIGMSLGVVPIFVLFGYALAWFVTKTFGSESLKEKILWPNPKKTQD